MVNSLDRAYEFADKKGFSQQKRILEYIKQGNCQAIEKIMLSPSYSSDWEQVFGDDLTFARMSFEYPWSQACLVAIQDDIPEREVSGLFIRSQQSLWEATSVKQIMDLNANFHIQLVQCVAARQQEGDYSLPVQVAKAYIREHVCEPMTVSSVAKAIGYSRSHLSHIYRRETGETAYGFIQSEKLKLAEQLLLTFIHPMADIWRELGFCSQSHFNTFFRKLTGVLPHEYRQNAKDAIAAGSSNEDAPIETEPTPALSLSFKNQTSDYQEALESVKAYAEETGFRQETYFLYCVKRGRVSELETEFSDPQLSRTLDALFKDNRTLAYQTFMFMLPQIHGAAVEGGLGMKSALRLYMGYFEKAQDAGTHELLELNREAFIAFARRVADTNVDLID